MTVVTVTRWWCTGCDAAEVTVPGADQATRNKLDKAAERHTKATGHTTQRPTNTRPDPTRLSKREGGAMRFDGAGTYPVGVLDTIQRVVRALTAHHPELHGKRGSIIRREVRKEWRYISRQVKAHDWRAVRNSFNGYLCEHDGHPHNCGSGWTKRRAERNADRLCERAMQETLAEWWPK